MECAGILSISTVCWRQSWYTDITQWHSAAIQYMDSVCWMMCTIINSNYQPQAVWIWWECFDVDGIICPLSIPFSCQTSRPTLMLKIPDISWKRVWKMLRENAAPTADRASALWEDMTAVTGAKTGNACFQSYHHCPGVWLCLETNGVFSCEWVLALVTI